MSWARSWATCCANRAGSRSTTWSRATGALPSSGAAMAVRPAMAWRCAWPDVRRPRPATWCARFPPGSRQSTSPRRVHRIRRRREYFLADSGRPQPGGIEDALSQLKQQGLSLDDVLQLLATLRIQPILMAHPTESTRRTQLRRQQRMADVAAGPAQSQPRAAGAASSVGAAAHRDHHRLADRGASAATPDRGRRARTRAVSFRRSAVSHRARRSTRRSPARWRNSMALSVSRPGSAHRAAVRHLGGRRHGAVTPTCMPRPSARPWRASSRSSSTSTSPSASSCRSCCRRAPAASASRRHCAGASTNTASCCPARVPRRRRATTRCPIACSLRRWASACARPMTGGPVATSASSSSAPTCCWPRSSLQANRGVHAGYQLVRRLLLRVDTFGFHLATLDLKQRADVHHRSSGRAWTTRSGCSATPADRLQRLADMLERDVGPVAPLDALGKRTLAVFETAHAVPRAFRRSVPSATTSWRATQGPEDLLAPLVLARWAGVDDRRSGADRAGLRAAVRIRRQPAQRRQDHARAAGQSRTIARTWPRATCRSRCSSAIRRPVATAATWACAWPSMTRSATWRSRWRRPASRRSSITPAVAAWRAVASRLDELIRAAPPDTVDGTCASPSRARPSARTMD